MRFGQAWKELEKGARITFPGADGDYALSGESEGRRKIHLLRGTKKLYAVEYFSAADLLRSDWEVHRWHAIPFRPGLVRIERTAKGNVKITVADEVLLRRPQDLNTENKCRAIAHWFTWMFTAKCENPAQEKIAQRLIDFMGIL